MNCNEIRELISCMLDHELNAEDSAVVAEHLAECPECMRVFEAFHTISLSLEELEDVPAGFTEDVMSRIHASTKTKDKPRRFGIVRFAALAGMAACMALVMMAGTGFANTHMYIGGGKSDAAEFVHIRQATPTPASIEDEIVYMNEDDGIVLTDSGLVENTSLSDSEIPDGDDVALTPAAAVSAAPAATPAVSEEPIVTPTPMLAVTPTPIPPMDLLFMEDLLMVAEEADASVLNGPEAYTVSFTDDSGTQIELKLWIIENRICCQNAATGTVWFTVGTPAQLTALLGIPEVTPTVSPAA